MSGFGQLTDQIRLRIALWLLHFQNKFCNCFETEISWLFVLRLACTWTFHQCRQMLETITCTLFTPLSFRETYLLFCWYGQRFGAHGFAIVRLFLFAVGFTVLDTKHRLFLATNTIDIQFWGWQVVVEYWAHVILITFTHHGLLIKLIKQHVLLIK